MTDSQLLNNSQTVHTHHSRTDRRLASPLVALQVRRTFSVQDLVPWKHTLLNNMIHNYLLSQYTSLCKRYIRQNWEECGLRAASLFAQAPLYLHSNSCQNTCHRILLRMVTRGYLGMVVQIYRASKRGTRFTMKFSASWKDIAPGSSKARVIS